MMLTEQVFAQALVLAGEPDERQRALLRVLCRSSCTALSGQLRNGIQPEDCLADFVCAAGLMALAALSEAGEQEQTARLTAGDVTVEKTRNNAAANCLRWQAKVLMAPYLKDGFLFRGV